METENSYPPQRIAAASICGVIAAALVGPAVNDILQLGQQQWPQWTIWFLVIGGIFFIGALLILVPIQWWRNIKNSICGSPSWIKRTYIWLSRGPKWLVSEPIIFCDKVNPMPIGQHGYTTTLSLTIENRDDYLLEGQIYSLELNIVQQVGRTRLRCILRPDHSYQIQVQPHHKETYVLHLYGQLSSRMPYGLKFDIERPYDWGIQGIMVNLSEAGGKELHRGLYFKSAWKSKSAY